MPRVLKDKQDDYPMPIVPDHMAAPSKGEWRFIILLTMMVCVLVAWVTVDDADAAPWHSTQASYYTLFGNATSCGVTMSATAWHVAALTPAYARCGLKLTICRASRCAHVRVMDRGAWRTDNRMWDLTPRLKHALHCPDLCNVSWTHGWLYR